MGALHCGHAQRDSQLRGPIPRQDMESVTSAFGQLQSDLRAAPKTWLVTGAAGFIGSHLLEALLQLDQQVIGVDNFHLPPLVSEVCFVSSARTSSAS